MSKNKSLKEYASNSAYERYMAIILDPDKNEFKTISGLFHDKKEVYEKMRNRGLVCRKVYEARIFDWILDNAKTTMDAYLMLSTAFSKWRGNNMLSDYYVKLLNDLPKINREKRKGDPQSIGDTGGWYKESVLKEVYQAPERQDTEYMSEKNVRIYPMISYPSGKMKEVLVKKGEDKGKTKLIPEFTNKIIDEYKKGIPFKVLTFDTDDINKKYDDPEFYRLLFKMAMINKIGKNYEEMNLPNASISYAIKNEDTGEVDLFDKSKWMSNYSNKNRNKGKIPYDWLPKDTTQSHLSKMMKKLEKAISETEDEVERESLKRSLDELKFRERGEADAADYREYITPDEAEELDNIKDELNEIENMKRPDNVDRKEFNQGRFEYREELRKQKQEIINNALKRKEKWAKEYGVMSDYEWNNKANELIRQANSTYSATNPIHGGDIEKPITVGQTNAFKAKKELNRMLKAAQKAKQTGRVVKLKQGLGIKDPVKLTNAQKKAIDDKVNLNTLKRKDTLLRNQTNNFNKDYSSLIVNKMIQNSKDVDVSKVNDAQLKVLNNKIKQFKDSNVDNPREQAKAYYNDPKNSNEFINNLKKSYKELMNKSSMGEAVQVNDSASWLYNTQPRGQNLVGTIEEETTKGTLNQKFFNGNVLREEVRQALLKIADKFKNELDLPFEPVDIYFTGSCANYNYNEYSDIDLHLVYDFEEAGVNAEILSNYLFTAKKVFNDKYDIKIKGYPVELGAENQAEPLVSSGVYSLVQNKWIKEPNNANTEIQEPDAPFYQKIVNDIEEAIQSNDSKTIGDMWKELAQLRKISLADEGEFGPGNTLFKMLRNKKYLERLKDAYYNSESDRLSLESLEEIQ